MKKRLLLSGGLIVLLALLAGGWLFSQTKPATKATPSKVTTAKATVKQAKKPTYQPLTTKALSHDRDLTYSSIIYYGIKHTKIQRWQEVADFKLGWQLEVYPNGTATKCLVWPDQNIKDDAKQLAPNWFKLSGQTVKYHSFIVHSFRKDMTVTVTLSQIVKQLNADHAATKVRQMPGHLTVVHHKTAS